MQFIESFHGEYRWLSNFWECNLVTDIFGWPRECKSVEHAYQAAKCELPAERNAILEKDTPGGAKRLGKKVKIRDDWDLIKLNVMRELLMAKFCWYANPDLTQMLVDTGDAILIEGNTWGDTFWGRCNGVGQNNLGDLLMQVRAVRILDHRRTLLPLADQV